MSRPSFFGILLLTCGLFLLAGLVLWHHERLIQLDQQLMELRLEKKLLRAGPVPTEPEALKIRSVPEPPRQRQTVERSGQDETLRRLSNIAIDEECHRRGLSTDTLGETWRCVGTPPEGKR